MSVYIKETIKDQGLTVQEIADRMNISKYRLNHYIKGNPSVETLEKISQALGVHISELFDKPQENKDTITCPNCGKRFKMEE